MRIAVIGAGPAGLTAAHELARGGANVDLFEASPHVGGMSRTIELWGQRVDLGPHRFFSRDPRVNQLWQQAIGEEYVILQRLTRIYYQNQFYQYPLIPSDVFTKLGLRETAASIASYLKCHWGEQSTDPAEISFEDWVVRRFGRRLFETFFKSYSEKLWGIACSELSADFAAQRIRGLNLFQAMKASVTSGREHRTLINRFAYPKNGSGQLYQTLAQQFVAFGGTLNLEQPVKAIEFGGQEEIRISVSGNDCRHYDHVISTMPLTHLIQSLPSIPDHVRKAVGALEFRNTTLVYLRMKATDLFPDQWLYIHDPSVRIGRVTNFRNWSPALYSNSDETILCCELWSDHRDAVWNAAPEPLIAQVESELKQVQLLQDQTVIDGHVIRIPHCYPIYRRGYQRHVNAVADYLHSLKRITAIGRYGAFKYNNQDHSILMGILAAENLLYGKQHDLWQVNADREQYHEASPAKPSSPMPFAQGFNVAAYPLSK